MKITIYELLGLVKDGKAPRKINYNYTTYEYDEDNCFYYHQGLSLYRRFIEYGNCLDNKVEIIEEPKDNFTGWKMYQDGKVISSMDCSVDETKDNSIERLDIEENAINRNERYIRKEDNKFVNLSVADYELAKKINELIDEINKLKEK